MARASLNRAISISRSVSLPGHQGFKEVGASSCCNFCQQNLLGFPKVCSMHSRDQVSLLGPFTVPHLGQVGVSREGTCLDQVGCRDLWIWWHPVASGAGGYTFILAQLRWGVGGWESDFALNPHFISLSKTRTEILILHHWDLRCPLTSMSNFNA